MLDDWVEGVVEDDHHRGLFLARAVENGDLAEVERLLTKEVWLDEVDSDGECVIHKAAKKGHHRIVEALLRAGANIEAPTGHGDTALSLAAYAHERVVQLLVSAGANVKAGHGAPLLAAAQGGHREIVSTLIAGGADPNPEVEGWKPLHGAADLGRAQAAALLIAAGADLDASAWEGMTPLHHAAQAEESTRAGRGGYEEAVALLVSAGADVNMRDKKGRSPIEVAATEKQMGIVGVLMAAGAEVPETLKDLKNDARVMSGMKRLPRMLKWARQAIAAAPKRIDAARRKLEAARKEFEAARAARE